MYQINYLKDLVHLLSVKRLEIPLECDLRT